MRGGRCLQGRACAFARDSRAPAFGAPAAIEPAKSAFADCRGGAWLGAVLDPSLPHHVSGHRSDYDARRRWFDWLRRLALCRGRPVARTQLAGSGSAGASREKHSVRRPRDCKPNNRSSPGRAGVAFASARPASSTSGRGRSGPPEKALAPRSWSVPSCRRWRRTSSPPAPGRPSCAAPRLR